MQTRSMWPNNGFSCSTL